jgi:bleomycin hydrolase
MFDLIPDSSTWTPHVSLTLSVISRPRTALPHLHPLISPTFQVPQSLYPDSFNATASATMNHLITTKLREDALILRSLSSRSSSPEDKLTALSTAKGKMLREIHTILTLMLGQPPSPKKEFTWEYHDKDDVFHSLTSTPLKFAAELSTPEAVAANSGSDVRELFSLVNDPRNPYMELLTVDRLGNVLGARGITYVNVPTAVLTSACIAMLRANLPVFFGSDVGKFSSSTSGIMDPGLVDYELGFNVTLGMGKRERLMTGESAMTHAMVLTGVHVLAGEAVRWRVQNRWGEKAGSEGWFVMSRGWWEEWVFQAVVDPRYVATFRFWVFHAGCGLGVGGWMRRSERAGTRSGESVGRRGERWNLWQLGGGSGENAGWLDVC